MRDLRKLDNASLGALSIALNGYQEYEKTNPVVSRLFLDIVQLLIGSIGELNIWGIRDLLAKEDKRRMRDVTIKVISPTDSERVQQLARQERVVLKLIGEGYQTEEIGRLLGIANRTVANYKHEITTKLGVGTAKNLTKFAIDNLEIL